MSTVLDLSGSPLPAVELPKPLVPVSPDVQAQLVNVMAAIVHGQRPEEIAAFLTDGFPDWIIEALERPHELNEMNALVDVLLFVQQSPRG